MDVKRKTHNKPITSTSIIRLAQVLNSKTNRERAYKFREGRKKKEWKKDWDLQKAARVCILTKVDP
jgi:hypothetical protein